MAYLPDFEEDIFISYASIDDAPLLGDPTGWVTQLHANLAARVKQRLGADNVRLWRDIEIRDNDDFTKKIIGRLPKTAALLSVLSPSFLQREWTIRELEVFVQNAQRGAGLLTNSDRSRIFKVEKIEVPRESLPSAMQGTKSYKFYGEDPEQPIIKREFWPQLNKSNYFKALDNLAYDIANLLREMQRATARPERLAVYVAETTFELEDQFHAVRRELSDHGYLVLPEGELPHRGGEYVNQVRQNLEVAAMSVHLVGAKYGLIPEGEARSVVRIQHDLAMDRSADPHFVRLIWMPSDLRPTEDNQRAFVEYLHNDADVQNSAEVMVTRFDDLKTAMWDHLDAIKLSRARVRKPVSDGSVVLSAQAAAAPAAAAALDDPLTIYVICDRHDLSTTQFAALKNCLLDYGYEPVLPTESSLDDTSLTKHVANLKTCAAFLIYYGSGSADWFAEKLADYRQHLRGRMPRVVGKAVYVTTPDRADKREVRTNEALVLRGGSEFSAADIEPFLRQLGAARQARP